MNIQEIIANALVPQPIQMAKTYIQSRLANRDMVRHNYILGDTDDYWHRLAIAQQSRKGPLSGVRALMFGFLNELKDIGRDTLLGGKPFSEAPTHLARLATNNIYRRMRLRVPTIREYADTHIHQF